MDAKVQRPVQAWLAARGLWQRLALSVLAGALLTAGHPPVSLPWIAVLAVPLLILLVDAAPTPRAAAWIGWAAALGYFVTSLHWIGNAFLVDADRFAWLIPLGVLALPAGLGLFWAAAFWAARRLWSGLMAGPGLLALCLTLAEYARAHILTGFPWALPGYIWVDTPVMQAASWAGPFGVTALTVFVPGLIAMAMICRRWPALIGSVAVVASLWVWGAARVPDQVAYGADAPVVRVVQPNAPQHLKWVPGQREIFYERLLTATAQPADPVLGKPDVVIWPETAVSFLPATNPQETARIAAAGQGAPVILGALHGERTVEGEFWSNALFVVSPDGQIALRYDKHHLVPFGEYVPFDWILGRLGVTQFTTGGGFSAGPGPRTLHLDGLPSVSPLICYEAIFPYQAVSGERPEWMVQITNDAWFGGWAGPQQHLAQAKFRAVEQGLPMVRSANTGISAVIDPYGLEVVSLAMHNYNKIDARLPASIEPTLYSIYGDITGLLLAAFVGFFGYLSTISMRRD